MKSKMNTIFTENLKLLVIKPLSKRWDRTNILIIADYNIHFE